MAAQAVNVRRVAVIGAGVSGVAAAIHLRRAGLEVIVYERSRRAGGIWVFDDHVSRDPEYPSTIPSTGDSPEYLSLKKIFQHGSRQDSPMRDLEHSTYASGNDTDDLRTSFAPPGPCYSVLKNNVSTIEMEMTAHSWKDGTEEFVLHHVMADYIQDSAIDNSVIDSISFNTRVNDVHKVGTSWQIGIDTLVDNDGRPEIVDTVKEFDAVVVASGHYHACNIPDIPGLRTWKQQFPNLVQHSKSYRSPEQFRDKNVLLIGAGVSSVDIAKDIGGVARSVYQSSRGGPYDLPSHLLPDNGARIGGIKSFDAPGSSNIGAEDKIPATVTLQSGQQLCDIQAVIVCTGYHVSFPFMRQYHADGVHPEDADELCLVTNGQQTHNLHKEIFYIPDPTLAFIGVPYHVTTFSCFEFQAMALASVFSGQVSLPVKKEMRGEYLERIECKGAGRTFHSLKGLGDEIAYVNELVDLVNQGQSTQIILGHTQSWHEAYLRRVARQKVLFGKVRDGEIEKANLDRIASC